MSEATQPFGREMADGDLIGSGDAASLARDVDDGGTATSVTDRRPASFSIYGPELIARSLQGGPVQGMEG